MRFADIGAVEFTAVFRGDVGGRPARGSVDHDRMMFSRLFSQLKKHHLLALFSTIRLHRVQALMNLRLVLEAGAAAAFAIANTDLGHFADTDEDGLLNPTKELGAKRYGWHRAPLSD